MSSFYHLIMLVFLEIFVRNLESLNELWSGFASNFATAIKQSINLSITGSPKILTFELFKTHYVITMKEEHVISSFLSPMI